MPRFRMPAVVLACLAALLLAACDADADADIDADVDADISVDDEVDDDDAVVDDDEAFGPGICESYAMWVETAEAFPGDEPDESVEQADQSASTTALAELGQANDGDLPQDVHTALSVLGDPDTDDDDRDNAERIVKDFFGPECGNLGGDRVSSTAVAPADPGGVLNLDDVDHSLTPGCHTAGAGTDRYVMNAASVGPGGAEVEIATTDAGFAITMTLEDGETWSGTSSTPAVVGADNLSGAALLDGPGGSEADSSFILNDVSALLPCAGSD